MSEKDKNIDREIDERKNEDYIKDTHVEESDEKEIVDQIRGFDEKEVVEQIENLLDQKNYAELKEILTAMNPVDISTVFEEMNDNKIPLLFRLLPKEEAAEVFVEMEADAQELLIRGFSDNELKEVLDELYLDDAVDIVEEMPANVVKRILLNTDSDTRRMINEILKYPDDSAGSIMTIEYVSLRLNMTVSEAIKRIRRTGIDKETIYTCYVTDSSRFLHGAVSIKTLLLADERMLQISLTSMIYLQSQLSMMRIDWLVL